MSDKSLYQRLGGYEGIVAFVDDLLPRLKADGLLGRFWENRSIDGIARERQLLIDYLAFKTGGSMYYTGREMKVAHEGMNISNNDWEIFLEHAGKTIETLGVPKLEASQVVAFISSLKDSILV